MDWMFMPFRRYADFSGRSRRMEFWMWQVFQFLVYIVVLVLSFALGGSALMMAGNNPSSALAAGGTILIIFAFYGIYCLAIIIPSLAVAVRRLHDTNRTGWWVLGPLAPYVLLVVAGAMASGSPDSGGPAGILALVSMIAMFVLGLVLLVFYFLDGTPGTNRYGSDPKGRGEAQVFA
jgi:uncharacterized membrane protein YhaH (DUF805 family)